MRIPIRKDGTIRYPSRKQASRRQIRSSGSCGISAKWQRGRQRLEQADRTAGKRCGFGNRKIGNAHLKWALSEATLLLMKQSAEAKRFIARKEKKHGKGKAIAILSAKLGRAIYYILKRKEPFDPKLFFTT